jgi:hypothetical protein
MRLGRDLLGRCSMREASPESLPELRPEVTPPERPVWRRLATWLGLPLATSVAVALALRAETVEIVLPEIVLPEIVLPEIVLPEPAPPEIVAAPPAASEVSPPDDPLGCAPVPEAPDNAAGTRLARHALPELELGRELSARVSVVAAAAAPQIAYSYDGHVRVSDDDGATFRQVLGGRPVDQVAMSPSGVLYARSGTWLGIRTPDGARRWREVQVAACESEDCHDRIATLGEAIVWLHDEQIAISHDHGATWRWIDTSAQAWNVLGDGELFTWRGSLYETLRYWDRCGVDDWPTYRLSAEHRVSHTIFQPGYRDAGDQLAALVPADDVESSWSWEGRCWHDELDEPRPCPVGASARWQMLAAQTLRPVEGGRTLAVYDGSLVEVCERGARVVYRKFPLPRISAVDRAGRPLVAYPEGVLRWSPQHGWRRLASLPLPPQAE